MKTKEILDLSIDELTRRKRELRDESFHFRLQQQSGQLEKPSQIRATRREVARIETALKQKSRAAAQTTTKL